MVGEKYGRWTVVSMGGRDSGGRLMLKCVCDCGITKIVEHHNLISGKTRSCGCLSRQKTSQLHLSDETGKKYGRLTVVGLSHRNNKGRVFWKCKCSCGADFVVAGYSLRSGNTRSCGCLKRELQSGENHYHWKGGRSVSVKGYVQLVNKKHPKVTTRGYVYEHRLVMEQMLGRYLEPEEIVHHCNGDKADNRPYNLRLFANTEDHTAYHAKLRKDERECDRRMGL
jgi:hypothetical protein